MKARWITKGDVIVISGRAATATVFSTSEIVNRHVVITTTFGKFRIPQDTEVQIVSAAK